MFTAAVKNGCRLTLEGSTTPQQRPPTPPPSLLIFCPFLQPFYDTRAENNRDQNLITQVWGRNFLLYISTYGEISWTSLLFRTCSVQCMVVEIGIISCSRLSGLIRVLFIRVNWYLKSPLLLQWQGFFTLNYLAEERSPACAAPRLKRKSACSCTNLDLHLKCIYLFIEAVTFKDKRERTKKCFSCCVAQKFRLARSEVALDRKLLSHDRAPHQAHLLSADHLPLTESSHTFSLSITNSCKKQKPTYHTVSATTCANSWHDKT